MDDNAKVATMIDAQMKRMRRCRDETQRRVLQMRAAISREAETKTRASRSLPDSFGRGTSSWTKRHEAEYQYWRGIGLSEHRKEMEGLEAKLVRQNTAISNRHLKAVSREQPA